ncbi:MAG: PIN domain-containing protein [Candidatus Margulisbacteria bacterium]|jgi:predicted nucleic acid-binding protein|nr:PIN domain-containing protein [Candidatus Margulisiibacteriota bacterium]
MKILLDTNIIVDVLARREGYADSLQILKSCERKQIRGYISALTITDVTYILRKYLAPDKLRGALRDIVNLVEIADVTKSDIRQAFASAMSDFEDAVQAACAKRLNAAYIVTRNIRDFVQSVVPAVLPTDLLKKN